MPSGSLAARSWKGFANRSTEVRIPRPGEQDLLQAITQYEKQAEGLCREFLEEFEQGVALIRQYPEASPRVPIV